MCDQEVHFAGDGVHHGGERPWVSGTEANMAAEKSQVEAEAENELAKRVAIEEDEIKIQGEKDVEEAKRVEDEKAINNDNSDNNLDSEAELKHN